MPAPADGWPKRCAPAGHDVAFVGDWDKDPGDEDILALARAEQRVVVTRDKDFGTLAVRDRQTHCGIVRLVELPPSREQARGFCSHTNWRCAAEHWSRRKCIRESS